MLNKVLAFVRQHRLLEPGEQVVCAVSGGADSVALLFAMYLLKEKLDIRLSAAHFNHHLRGAESDRDEIFVREFCDRYQIPLYLGEGTVVPGKKGLEAAARDVRYGFLKSLPGKIATAHTADDNAETVLLHLVRGTGLKGLGGIAPINGNLIRPMLGITRQEVEAFLREWCLSYVTDSSNETDQFLRNRLRHHVMPLLKAENPKFAENVSSMALGLRQDEACLAQLAQEEQIQVEQLKNLHPAIRSRVLEGFLKDCGVKEPERSHLEQVEKLLFSPKPSAKALLPGGVAVARNYDRLEVRRDAPEILPQVLTCPGKVELDGMTVICEPAERILNDREVFTVVPQGEMVVRSRETGDAITLNGGTKSLKKLFIDRKIPAAQRLRIPVIADGAGVLGVYTIGAGLDRIAKELPAVQIRFEQR